MNPTVNILIGDCREKLRELPENSIHCVVTSPPYWALRSYLPDGDPAKQLEIGSEETIHEFLKVMRAVFQEIYRVLRPDGTCWVNFGDTYRNKSLMGIPWQVALMLSGQSIESANMSRCPKCQDSRHRVFVPKTAASYLDWEYICERCEYQANSKEWDKTPWFLRSEIIWHKPNPVPEPDRGRPTVAHETVFLLTKSERYFYDNDAIREPVGDEPDWEEYRSGLGSNTGCDTLRWSAGYKKCSHNLIHPNGRQKRSVWTIPTKGFKGSHYATFPPALVEPCILAGTSEKGCCVACGAPRKRVSEITPEYQEKLGKSWHNHEADRMVGQRGVPSAFRGAPARITTGWEATCPCGAEFIPCTVLDPFGGSGTTGEVALKYGRSSILIDLDERNREFMEQRTAQLRLGFTS